MDTNRRHQIVKSTFNHISRQRRISVYSVSFFSIEVSQRPSCIRIKHKTHVAEILKLSRIYSKTNVDAISRCSLKPQLWLLVAQSQKITNASAWQVQSKSTISIQNFQSRFIKEKSRISVGVLVDIFLGSKQLECFKSDHLKLAKVSK